MNLGILAATEQTLTLHPTTESGDNVDILLYGPLPNNNYLTFAYNEVDYNGGSNSIVKFDLSGLSGFSSIVSATLRLYYNFNGAGYSSGNVGVYRILSGNSDWVASQATYNNRKTSTSWAGSAGCNTSGTDYSSTIMGTVTIPGSYGFVDVTLNTTEFASMATNNYGFIIKDVSMNAGAVAFASFNDATADNHPKLTIVYT